MSDYISAHQIGFLFFGFGGCILACFALFYAGYLHFRYRQVRRDLVTFFAGKDARSLEETILSHAKRLEHTDGEIEELYTISNRVHDVAQRGVHKVAMMRFNPFNDMGSNQSFALALLDGKYNGIVLSSLHTREGTRIYAKDVVHGNANGSDFTQEERSVISQACSDR